MKCLTNKKSKRSPKEENFYVGSFKGEVKKVRSLANQVNRNPANYSEQADTRVVRRICAPIPPNQEQLAAEARGEKLEKYFNSMITVRVI